VLIISGRTMGNIAVTYCALDMKQDSLVYLEQTLQSFELALPRDHPDTGDKHVPFDYLVMVALDLILCSRRYGKPCRLVLHLQKACRCGGVEGKSS
jgi:hypothetical protein